LTTIQGLFQDSISSHINFTNFVKSTLLIENTLRHLYSSPVRQLIGLNEVFRIGEIHKFRTECCDHQLAIGIVQNREVKQLCDAAVVVVRTPVHSTPPPFFSHSEESVLKSFNKKREKDSFWSIAVGRVKTNRSKRRATAEGRLTPPSVRVAKRVASLQAFGRFRRRSGVSARARPPSPHSRSFSTSLV